MDGFFRQCGLGGFGSGSTLTLLMLTDPVFLCRLVKTQTPGKGRFRKNRTLRDQFGKKNERVICINCTKTYILVLNIWVSNKQVRPENAHDIHISAPFFFWRPAHSREPVLLFHKHMGFSSLSGAVVV